MIESRVGRSRSETIRNGLNARGASVSVRQMNGVEFIVYAKWPENDG